MAGGGAADDAAGGGGADLLVGGGGADTLDGGAEPDALIGGIGDDMLIGGRGADVLTGSGGADAFVFQEGGGRDVITDFQVGEDNLVFETATGFADLSLRDTTAGLRIQAEGAVLLVEDVKAADLAAIDMMFLG